MKHLYAKALLLGLTALAGPAWAHQAPWAAPNVPVSHRDRVYAAEQFSNTLSVNS